MKKHFESIVFTVVIAIGLIIAAVTITRNHQKRLEQKAKDSVTVRHWMQRDSVRNERKRDY